MSQQVHPELETKRQQLLQGPLKHIRGAALAAALLPLASIAAAPASAQTGCSASGGAVCGFVFDDTNNNGLQDAGEPGIEGVKLKLTIGGDTFDIETGPTGIYLLPVQDGTYTIAVEAPMGTQPSPPNTGGNSNDSIDSDGVPDTFGRSVTTVTVSGNIVVSDFGFHTTPPSVLNPGTGTPGYWKNHPEAWPVSKITIGGIEYSKADAITWLGKVGKDKTTTMFSSLVSAKLNMIILNDPQCVYSTTVLADAWMHTYGPVGNNVAASSYAWSVGEPLHKWMDAYNNGLLCAPHRN